MSSPELYLVVDANVLAGYYAPQTFNKASMPAADKITNIIESVRKGCSTQIKLLTPEICVAEAQTVLSKHANPAWSGKKKSENPQAIHRKSYNSIYNKMMTDLHGGKLIESIPLQRYHVLAKHLITPIDHNLKTRNINGTYSSETGGTDQLICGMAIWLTRLLGQERIWIITADYRLAKVIEKAHKVTDEQFVKWGIKELAEKHIGFHFTKAIYPNSLYLPTATDLQLRKIFGCYPLPIQKKKPLKTQRKVRSKEIDKLVVLYKNIGIGRDNLPYSPNMKKLTKQFNDATGLSLSESELWKVLITRLKKGGGKIVR